MENILTKYSRIVISFVIAALWIISLGGCSSTKKLVYFQGVTSHDDTLIIPEPFMPTIKKGDILSVQVSSLNPEASAYFKSIGRCRNKRDHNAYESINPKPRLPGGHRRYH